jgi:hypothetical protein
VANDIASNEICTFLNLKGINWRQTVENTPIRVGIHGKEGKTWQAYAEFVLINEPFGIKSVSGEDSCGLSKIVPKLTN